MPASRRLSALALFLTAILTLGAPILEAQEISDAELFEQTAEAARQALEHYGTWDDPEALARLNDIGYRLAVVAGFSDFPFTFYLIDMPVPNAFALPGGQIFITRGMLALGLDDDMLACLLGHEIAHVSHRHGTRLQKRAMLLNILSQALLVGVMIGAEDGPENPRDPYGARYSPSRKGALVQGAAATGMVVSELLLRDYSRDFEDEADQEGQRMAAAAGFDPAGARELWELMIQRIPQSDAYGYWRTHPFSDSRMRAANVRARELAILDGRPAEDYRAATQKVLIEHAPQVKKYDELGAFLEDSALVAWPQGPRAEEIRLARLHEAAEAERERLAMARDYGELVRRYRAQIEAVRSLTPESALLPRLERELGELRAEAEELYPQAVAILEEGVYETPFLETFSSNYPTAPEAPRVALELGNAYSRVGRADEAVEHYLRAAEAGPESEYGERALFGLRNLAPNLQELVALEQIGEATQDEELRRLASERLDEHAGKYKDIANGAEYLKRFPEGPHAEAVRERLESLAKNLYGEVLLYQAVGDSMKALERIQLILTHAPATRAAESLRERAELELG